MLRASQQPLRGEMSLKTVLVLELALPVWVGPGHAEAAFRGLFANGIVFPLICCRRLGWLAVRRH